MKKLSLLKNFYATAILMFSFGAFGQGFVLQDATSSVVPSACNQEYLINVAPMQNSGALNADLNVTLLGSNYTNGLIYASINWGDGSTTTHAGQMSGLGQNIQFNGPLLHLYATPGTYVIVMNFLNSSNNTSVSHTVMAVINTCNVTVYSFSTIVCSTVNQNLLANGVPYNFVNSTGGSTVIWVMNGAATTSSLAAGTYTVTVLSSWLQANGLIDVGMTSPVIYNVNPSSNALTLQSIFDCDSSANTDYCVSGVAFCDLNQNGVMDNNESAIPNAVISIYGTGLVQTVTTNASGNYTYVYPASASNNVSIIANLNWLSLMGFTAMSNTTPFVGVPCSQNGQVVNIPIICDSISTYTNCIGGWVFCDANNNGVLNTNESGFANVPVTITGQNNVAVTVFTNQNGNFFYSGNALGTGFAVVTVNQNWLLQNNYTFTGNLVQTVSVDCNNAQPLYFPVICPGTTPCADLWSNVTPWIGYYQNQTNSIQLTYGNSGPAAAQSYTVTLTYPANATPVLSSINNPNYTITGSTITWNLSSNSSYFNVSDVIYFTIPGGQTNGTANTFSTTITANGNNTDCNSSNNNGSLTMLLGNSYDPNDKNVDLPAMISPFVQDELTYLVRFQNTGTAPAQDIYILDTLSANLDWSTFVLLDASHYVQVINLGNGVMKFNFPNIWLPDSTTNLEASQGSFSYRIKENVGNGIGTEIENTAYIFFDWNPAIVTNTTYNQNNVLSVQKLEENKLEVYPNPFGDVLNIRSDENVSSVKVYDLTGKLITSKNGTSIHSISTTDMKTGVYLIEITAAGQTTTKRVIKK